MSEDAVHDKKIGLKYVSRTDELLNIIATVVGSKKRCFRLALEFPNGKRYWECPDTL
jgi:hypothetical protein